MARIILAEDDSSMRKFLARAIEKAGHEVIAVSDGAKALPLVEAGEFDLLLTDIVMPEMDGIELAQRAVRRKPDVKVMFITGFAAVAMHEKSRTPRSAKVFSKPFHLKDLIAQIELLLAA